jgi:hypothetical protein
MVEEASDNSLKEKFDSLKKGKNSYQDIRRTILKEDSESGSKEEKYHMILNQLKNFNQYINQGNFKIAEDYANDIYWNLLKKDLFGFDTPLSYEERLKFLHSFNKRIERGLNVLSKSFSKENFKEMERILKYSECLENSLQVNLSNLEKSLVVLSIGSILAGIFFLSPNLTGNVVGNLAENSTNIFGGVLFILGTIGLFFTLKK